MLDPNWLFSKKYLKNMESGLNPMLKPWMLSAASPTITGFKKIPNDLQPGGCCLKSFMSAFD
jgi:hypothetical protein